VPEGTEALRTGGGIVEFFGETTDYLQLARICCKILERDS
jgi:hypothetical protein